MTSTAKGLAALTCGVAATALLAACKPGAQEASAQDAPPPLASLPLTNVAAGQAHPGPVAVDLPYARPARIGPALDPDDGYAYLDRAYFLNDAFGEAPPDYGFGYDEETPWVWQTDDGFIRVVEALPYGDRYYYYEPDQDYPFLIRDPDYAYAYADGDLVALYDSSGALRPPEDLMLHAPIAGRELARGGALFRRAGARQAVALQAWTTRRGQVVSELGQWQKQRTQQTAWRIYHDAHKKQEQTHWAPERFRREASAARMLQQVHDPDGAQHAWREARHAQDIARKAHVRIALLPHASPAGAPAGQPRGAPARMGPTRLAMSAPVRGPETPPGPSPHPSASRPARGGQLAMALSAQPHAQFNVRGAARTFEAHPERHMRAAEQARAPHQDRPAATRDAHVRLASEPAPRPVEAPRTPDAPRLGVATAQPNHPNAGGGGHPSPGGGGHDGDPREPQHQQPQQQNDRGHGHGH